MSDDFCLLFCFSIYILRLLHFFIILAISMVSFWISESVSFSLNFKHCLRHLIQFGVLCYNFILLCGCLFEANFDRSPCVGSSVESQESSETQNLQRAAGTLAHPTSRLRETWLWSVKKSSLGRREVLYLHHTGA